MMKESSFLTTRPLSFTLEAVYNAPAWINVKRLGTCALCTAVVVVKNLTRIADYPIKDAMFWKVKMSHTLVFYRLLSVFLKLYDYVLPFFLSNYFRGWVEIIIRLSLPNYFVWEFPPLHCRPHTKSKVKTRKDWNSLKFWLILCLATSKSPTHENHSLTLGTTKYVVTSLSYIVLLPFVHNYHILRRWVVVGVS